MRMMYPQAVKLMMMMMVQGLARQAGRAVVGGALQGVKGQQQGQEWVGDEGRQQGEQQQQQQQRAVGQQGVKEGQVQGRREGR